MEGKMRQRLGKALAEVDEHQTRGPRLVDDAQRLWSRVRKFLKLKLVPTEPDVTALELACMALQLPQKQGKAAVGKLGRFSIKQRAEQAAELLVTLMGDDCDEGLLDRTIRLLHELPQRQPMIEEARLLADAINLEDFGVIGLTNMLVQLALQGGGAMQLIDAFEKRDQYGYWEARLKEGFHFDAVRAMAQMRLKRARELAGFLIAEVQDDQP